MIKVTRSHVIDAYRLFLGREPESESAIRSHLIVPSLRDLARAFIHSPEFEGRSENLLNSTTAADAPSTPARRRERKSLRIADLDDFVRKTDSLGGVGSPAVDEYWAGLNFEPDGIDERLDPYSDQYVDMQIALYRKISLRELDQSKNEMTAFDLDKHVNALNPYAHPSPSQLAIHLARLSIALNKADLHLNERILDMGCGWGLSSELLAYSGLHVTALDINPNFVELVRRRAAERQLPISAVQGTFESFPPGPYDGALFYECLHHAVCPWETLSLVLQALRPGGKLVLAGEPVNDMWKHWGLRTDPLSVYCIRKFGWFESGWSAEFLRDCLKRCGFEIAHFSDDGPIIGWIIVAKR